MIRKDLFHGYKDGSIYTKINVQTILTKGEMELRQRGGKCFMSTRWPQLASQPMNWMSP